MPEETNNWKYIYAMNFWTKHFVKVGEDKLICQKFITDDAERILISNYLKNETSSSALKETIYNGALIDGKTYLDDKSNVHDAMSFFTLSYICTLFWLLEDQPISLVKECDFDIINYTKKIAAGLDKSRPDIIINEFLKILSEIDRLSSNGNPEKCHHIDINTYQNLVKEKYNVSNYNEHIKDEIDRIRLFEKPFDVYKLFSKPNELVDSLIYNIYDFLKQKSCSSIIGLERSGVTLASLVAYTFDIPLHILRTVPKLALLPSELSGDNVLVVDDISITGTNLKLATNHIIQANANKPPKLKTLVFARSDAVKGIDKYFITTKDSGHKPIRIKKSKLKKFKPIETPMHSATNLKKDIVKNCVHNNYWNSAYAYCNVIFRLICNELLKLIEEKAIQNKCLIISTSTFGLPFASVISYRLRAPLYLFSRRPNLLVDFSPVNCLSLKHNLEKGYTNIIFIDDVYDTGVTERLAEQKIEKIAKEVEMSGVQINKFVLAFLGDDKPNNLEYIVDKDDLCQK